MSLALCPSCHRHVKSRDARCPFCGTTMRLASGSASPATAAVLIGLGVALSGCSSSSDPGAVALYAPPPDSGVDSYAGEVTPLYGPPPDTGVDTTVVDTASTDTGDTGAVAAYGPPPDTGSGDATSDTKADSSPTDSLPAGAYGPPPDTGAG
jgi:hypothetical protein